jgi:hypothetical protein
LAVFDQEITRRIENDFQQDLQQSERMTPKHLRATSLGGRLLTEASWVFRDEQ